MAEEPGTPRRFSARHGFESADREITVHQDAPPRLRSAVVPIAYEAQLSPKQVRAVVCRVLRVREDPDNWSDFPNVDGEAREHLEKCEWYEVYDIIEALHAELAKHDNFYSRRGEPSRAPFFADEINKLFRKLGIGWHLENGEIVVRGQEVFEEQVQAAQTELAAERRNTAAGELHEALHDLSRRARGGCDGSNPACARRG
jgi:hypothetical protein